MNQSLPSSVTDARPWITDHQGFKTSLRESLEQFLNNLQESQGLSIESDSSIQEPLAKPNPEQPLKKKKSWRNSSRILRNSKESFRILKRALPLPLSPPKNKNQKERKNKRNEYLLREKYSWTSRNRRRRRRLWPVNCCVRWANGTRNDWWCSAPRAIGSLMNCCFPLLLHLLRCTLMPDKVSILHPARCQPRQNQSALLTIYRSETTIISLFEFLNFFLKDLLRIPWRSHKNQPISISFI